MKDAIADLKANFAKKNGDFTMEYISLSGRYIGSKPEGETRLTVNGRGESSLFRNRGPGDSHQLPPGRFTGRVEDSALISFLDAFAASGIQEFKPDLRGPRDPITFLHIHIKDQHWEFTWGFSKTSPPPGMIKLKGLLYDWRENACPVALWSLILEVDSLVFKQGKLSARLKVQNRGKQSIRIAHPASPGFGSHFGVYLEYGEAQLIEEGYTPAPIETKKAPLVVPASVAPRFIDLKPGSPLVIDYSATLEGQAPRGWIGAFGFLHYLPEDSVDGVPVFNGAFFTEELTW